MLDKEEIQKILDEVFDDLHQGGPFSDEELEVEVAEIDEEMKDALVLFVPPEKKQEILENLHQMNDFYEEHKEDYKKMRR